ncbi:MAG TPA: hypothetical protein VKF81_13180 [Blastocatellia bacterium]|nr:hypothetical protein [Blastocatellia bacterium]
MLSLRNAKSSRNRILAIRFAVIILLCGALPMISAISTPKVGAQAPVGRGRFHVPSQGQTMEATVPFTITWELDNPLTSHTRI